MTGNGLQLSEDLASRFLVIMLDGGSSEPERRRFVAGFDKEILKGCAALLADASTIWRWGQLEGAKMPPGSPIGSYEVWTRHVRGPLLALGCRDSGAPYAG